MLSNSVDDLTCYNGMRDIFCDIACSPRQSELVKVTGHNVTDGAVTSIDFRLSRNKTQVIFDACNVSSLVLPQIPFVSEIGQIQLLQ